MEIIAIILSGLALLAATVCLVLVIREKKRSEKQRVASTQWVEAECAAATRAAAEYIDEKCSEINKEVATVKQEAVSFAHNQIADEKMNLQKMLNKEFAARDSRIANLEKGVIPDYEKAAAAVKSVNDFNAGLSAIMGFDPYEALRRDQQKEQFGGEVE